MKRLALVLFITLALVACSRKGPSPTDSPAPTSPANPTVPPTASATPTPSGPPAPRITIVPSATRLQSEQPTSQGESEGVGASPTGSAESPSTLVPSSTPTPHIIDAGATATLSDSPLPAPSESSATPGASSTPAGDNGTPTASSTPAETTATATPTTEAAASSTPTLAASASPTPQGEGWSFEKVYTFYDEDYQEFYIWGEVFNNTSSDQRITSLLPVVYEDGEPVTSEESVSAPTDYNQMRNAVSLAPDQSLPFSFRVYLPTGVVVEDNYEILVQAEPAEAARDDLDIPSDDFDSSDWPYYFYVEGTFENPGPDLSEYVAIFVTVYDEEEHVIGVGGFYQTSSSHLATGTHSFEIEVEPWDVVEYLELDVYSYKVHVLGY